MKKLVLLLLFILPFTLSAQEIIGKKRKQIDNIMASSALIIDTPEMSIWQNTKKEGSQFMICHFKEDKCIKTLSVYPKDRLAQWEKILNQTCAKVKSEDKVWLDQNRKLFFRILPGQNNTFALESTKSTE